MKIMLASESPIRRRALDILGLAYRKLSEAKARKVVSECPDAVVVSGDAAVSKGGKINEKPRNEAEAAQFLGELSGSEFQFVTALSIIHSQTQNMLSAVDTSHICFRQLVENKDFELSA